MAQSPAHKFGQIIGDFIEGAIEAILDDFAKKHNLYLDRVGPRPARTGRKVSWFDEFGNKHDLDYVMEKGGTATNIGKPVAFIESAWRRYTKHSRNKAQEIQGAILPLSNTYRFSAPFLGVILAGVFTEGAITQLTSSGFCVLYFRYESVVEAFREAGIDASFDEDTPIAVFQEKVRAWELLSQDDINKIWLKLQEIQSEDIAIFLESLEKTVNRMIESIRIIPLFGKSYELQTVKEAIEFIQSNGYNDSNETLIKFEITIRYNNGDRIEASFNEADLAVKFLKQYEEIKLRPAE